MQEPSGAVIVKLANGFHTKGVDMGRIQHVIGEVLKYGDFVIRCHPVYSMVTPEEFGRFKGPFAMELWNTWTAMSVLSRGSSIVLL